MAKNKKLRLSVLGLATLVAIGAMTLTGCSKAMQEAQDNIDNSVVTVMNADESIQERYNANFSDFTFLCADVAQADANQYNVDVNGLITMTTDKADTAYTTLSYLVDGKYFNDMDKATHEDIINKLATIVQNEKFQSVSVEKIGNPQALSNSMSEVMESPLDDYNMSKNFLYAVGNVQFDETENIAAFSTKDASRFSKTTVRTSYGLVGFDSEGKPKYGLVTSTKTDYQTFFIDHNVYIKLTPEEMAAAKNDHSIIFNKFNEYVKNNQKDMYVIQETNVVQDKDFSANMMDNVSLERGE